MGAVTCQLDPPLYRQAFLIDVPPPTLRRHVRSSRSWLQIQAAAASNSGTPAAP